RIARVGVRGVADTVGDGGVDVLHRAAPEPVVVEKVGVAHRASRAGTVALRAPGAENGAAGVLGIVGEFLSQRWKDGTRTGSALFQRLRDRGYQGSLVHLHRLLGRLPAEKSVARKGASIALACRA